VSQKHHCATILKVTKIWIDRVEAIQALKPEKGKDYSESGIYDESNHSILPKGSHMPIITRIGLSRR
jgi:hypothetical protein